MKKYEYKTLNVPTKGWMKYKVDFEALELLLNEMGKQGWDLAVCMNNIYQAGSQAGNVIVMKREISH